MRLIDADEAVKIIKRYDDRGLTIEEVTRVTDGIAKEIEAMPTVDAVEVRHGKWINISEPDENDNVSCECSLCGAGEEHAKGFIVPFCWKCGARMDGD